MKFLEIKQNCKLHFQVLINNFDAKTAKLRFTSEKCVTCYCDAKLEDSRVV